MIHHCLIGCLVFWAVSGQDISGKRPRPYYLSEISEEAPREAEIYKSSRRSERVPAYRSYDSPENKPDIEYAYPARYESDQAEYALQRNPKEYKEYEQIIKDQYAAQLRHHHQQQQQQHQQQQPNVEQYLKEVTPTTKTVYNQRPAGPGNSARSPSPARYVLQSASDQQSLQGQYQYQNPEAVQVKYQQYELQGPPQGPSNANAYSSRPSPQHPPRVQETPEEPSKSQIYVSQNIVKKPTKVKHFKPKPSEQLNIQPNVEYYRQLQVYHQQRQQQLEQLQQIQQNKARDFEPSQLISYETPDGQKVEYQEEPATYQPAKRPTSQGPTRYQLEQPQYESEQVEYQRPKAKQHPKYLPEPKTRYQASPIEVESSPEEAKYHAIKSSRSSSSSRYPTQHGQEAISYQPASGGKYQYSEESQPVPQYKDFDDDVVYERPQLPIRTRPERRYKQYLQRPHVRYVERPLAYSLSE